MRNNIIISLLLICFAAMAQTVSISSKQTPSNLLLQVRYDGTPIPVTAISIKIHYDTTIFKMDSARMNPTLVQGWGYSTTPVWVSTENFALSWFQTNFDDTLVLTNNTVIFNVWLHKKSLGCSNFNFLGGQANELTGLDYYPIPTNYVNSYICNNSQQSKEIEINGIKYRIINDKKYYYENY